MNFADLKKYAKEKGMLVTASFELTQNCNFGCKHCYCANKNSKSLSTQTVKDILDKLRNANVLGITFTGGEVLMRKDFLDIYMYAKKLGFFITVFTNASLITDEIIDVFSKYKPYAVEITLYGTNEKEYGSFTGKEENFLKVMHNIDRLYQNNVTIQLKTVAVKSAYKSLISGEYQKIADKYGVALNYDPIIFPRHDGNQDPLQHRLTPRESVYLDSLDPNRVSQWKERIQMDGDPFKFRCTGGVSRLSIDYEGNASICGLYRGESISLIDNDIETVRSHLLDVHNRIVKLAEESSCNSCKHRKICKWCPVYSSLENGTLDKKIDYFCKLSQARHDEFCK